MNEPESGEDHPQPHDPGRTEALVRTMRGRYSRLTEQAGSLVERESSRPTVNVGLALYERDRAAFAGVLGSAIALRLFLFLIPSLTALVGLLNLIGGPGTIASTLDATGTTGQVARDIETATTQSNRASIGILISGIVLLLWAGRGLTIVLAASAAGGWRLPAREAKPTVRMAGTLSGLLFTLIVITGVLGRIRKIGGIAATTSSFVLMAGVVTAGWFAVLWTLPSRTRDPGAQLPGAVVMGVCTAVLQWFMQFYLPGRVARSSATMGSLGIAVAALGYFFFVGRLMASTFVVNAVIWERFGSLSTLVFGLPGLRRIPRRWPSVARFFRLDEPDGPDLPEPPVPPEIDAP